MVAVVPPLHETPEADDCHRTLWDQRSSSQPTQCHAPPTGGGLHNAAPVQTAERALARPRLWPTAAFSFLLKAPLALYFSSRRSSLREQKKNKKHIFFFLCNSDKFQKQQFFCFFFHLLELRKRPCWGRANITKLPFFFCFYMSTRNECFGLVPLMGRRSLCEKLLRLQNSKKKTKNNMKTAGCFVPIFFHPFRAPIIISYHFQLDVQ